MIVYARQKSSIQAMDRSMKEKPLPIRIRKFVRSNCWLKRHVESHNGQRIRVANARGLVEGIVTNCLKIRRG